MGLFKTPKAPAVPQYQAPPPIELPPAPDPIVIEAPKIDFSAMDKIPVTSAPDVNLNTTSQVAPLDPNGIASARAGASAEDKRVSGNDLKIRQATAKKSKASKKGSTLLASPKQNTGLYIPG